MEASAQDQSCITLKVSDEGRKLLATYTPAPGRTLDRDLLHKAVFSQGFGEFTLSDESISAFLTAGEAATLPVTAEIGEKQEAHLDLEVSKDQMEARLNVHAASGVRITGETVMAFLARNGIVHGILDGMVSQVAKTGHADRILVAQGTPPQPGEDSRFESLIPEMQEQKPQVNEGETADYRNLGDIVSVSLGDPLMRRLRPTAGIPGKDLTGKELPAPDGALLPFAEDMQGVACDVHDPDLIVAAIAGYPVALQNGAQVEPIFRLKRVDLSTGNLHFKGSLEIEGDVSEGMEVTASEGITVGGIVEAARLDAGGDIEVKGGVIGHGKLSLGGTEGRQDAAQLKAGGKVTVQFAENALIRAEGEILVRELAMQSELTSGASIRIGEPGGRKGHLIGGLTRAATLVHAVVIGSHAGVPTLVEVGVDPALNQKLGYVRESLAEKEKLREELEKTLSYVAENPGSMEPGLFKLKERVYAKYQSEIAELNGEMKRLLKRLEVNAQAKVEVERQAFLGVQIRIGSSQLHLEEDLMTPVFTLGEEGITSNCEKSQ